MAAFAAEYTISVSQGRVVPHHDRMKDRLEDVPGNVDTRLTRRFNKELVCSYDFVGEFEDVFSSSKEKHNSRQKRKDRKIDSYYEQVINSKNGEHPFYEYCIQIGNRSTNGILKTPMKAEETRKLTDEELEALLNDDPNEKLARQALDNAMAKLQEKYPAFHFLYIGSHGDEPNGTYAYHVVFIPVGSGYKNGMPERCSLTRALADMGFHRGKDESNTRLFYPITKWKQDVEKMVEDEMNALGLSRTFKNEHREHIDTPQYVHEREINDKIEELKEQEVNLKFHKSVAETDREKFDEEKAEFRENAGQEIAELEAYGDYCNNQLGQIKAEFDKWQIDLERRENAVKQREIVVGVSENTVKQREIAVESKEKALTSREKAVEVAEGRLQETQDLYDEMIDELNELKPQLEVKVAKQVDSVINNQKNKRKKLEEKYKGALVDVDYINAQNTGNFSKFDIEGP